MVFSNPFHSLGKIKNHYLAKKNKFEIQRFEEILIRESKGQLNHSFKRSTTFAEREEEASFYWKS